MFGIGDLPEPIARALASALQDKLEGDDHEMTDDEKRAAAVPAAFMPLAFNPYTLAFTPPGNPDFAWPFWSIVQAPPCPKCDGSLDDCDCGIRLSINYDDAFRWLNTPGYVLVSARCLKHAHIDRSGIVRAKAVFVDGVLRYNTRRRSHTLQRLAVGYFKEGEDLNADALRKQQDNFVNQWSFLFNSAQNKGLFDDQVSGVQPDFSLEHLRV